MLGKLIITIAVSFSALHMAARADVAQDIQQALQLGFKGQNEEAIQMLENTLPKAEGIEKLRALHFLIDLKRIVGAWDEVPPLVDQFQALYPNVEGADRNPIWAANMMSEKAAAHVALQQNADAVKASATALKLYKNLSATWHADENGDWVSNTTGQHCPITWQDHVRYDAYDRDGDSRCTYWDSDISGGVALDIYKTAEASFEQNAADIAKGLEKFGQAAPEAMDVPEQLSELIPTGVKATAMHGSGQFAFDYLLLAPEHGEWSLSVSYSQGRLGQAKASLAKILPDLLS
ncbi:MAG: hypothetical protein PVF65_06350 [Sphingomonadales bacterium]|jgi:hypothetical protein